MMDGCYRICFYSLFSTCAVLFFLVCAYNSVNIFLECEKHFKCICSQSSCRVMYISWDPFLDKDTRLVSSPKKMCTNGLGEMEHDKSQLSGL